MQFACNPNVVSGVKPSRSISDLDLRLLLASEKHNFKRSLAHAQRSMLPTRGAPLNMDSIPSVLYMCMSPCDAQTHA